MEKNIVYIADRPGRFEICAALVRHKNTVATEIFKRVYIIRAEHFYAENVFRYVGFSLLFERVLEGAKIPQYKFIYDSISKTITAERVDD